MITIIFGKPGAGKTSLMAHFLQDLYAKQGKSLLKKSISEIERVNETRKTPLTLPDRPPIYSDFEVWIHTGYNKWFIPYFINGYYFGLANENMPTQFVFPYAKIFLSEAQRYFDSRKSSTFPRFAASAFEMHRHYGLDIWLDVQRVGLIDLNVRELCKRFIEVQDVEHTTSGTGEITASEWKCREFETSADVDLYLKSGDKVYAETSYRHEGNIFSGVDSRGHFGDFLPADGKGFTNLPFLRAGEKPAPGTEIFYQSGEPKGYRGMPPKKEKKEEKA